MQPVSPFILIHKAGHVRRTLRFQFARDLRDSDLDGDGQRGMARIEHGITVQASGPELGGGVHATALLISKRDQPD